MGILTNKKSSSTHAQIYSITWTHTHTQTNTHKHTHTNTNQNTKQHKPWLLRWSDLIYNSEAVELTQSHWTKKNHSGIRKGEDNKKVRIT